MARRKFGWHSGKLTVNELVIEDFTTNSAITITGNVNSGAPAISVTNAAVTGAPIGMTISLASTATDAYAAKFVGSASTTAGILLTATDSASAATNTAKVLRVLGGSTAYYIPLLSTFT